MLAKTHLAFGFLSGLIISPFINTNNTLIFFTLVLIGALLPDIDHPTSKISNKVKPLAKILSIFTKHRGVFHALPFAILISAIIFYFSSSYGIALFIGYSSHLLIDGLTKAGINFLHPFSHLHLSGFIETGKTGELIVFLIIIALIIIKII